MTGGSLLDCWDGGGRGAGCGVRGGSLLGVRHMPYCASSVGLCLLSLAHFKGVMHKLCRTADPRSGLRKSPATGPRASLAYGPAARRS